MRVAFVCVENSCRSQMAEALAKKMFPDRTVEFVSAGTHPAEKVDEGAITVLKEYGINWDGYPKTLYEIGDVDMIVTMGCDVECPVITGVKIVAWDISDPKGNGTELYVNTLAMIKKHLIQFMKNVENHK